MINKVALYTDLLELLVDDHDQFNIDFEYRIKMEHKASNIMLLFEKYVDEKQAFDATQVSGIGPGTVTKDDFK